MKLGMNLLLWTGTVTASHLPLFDRLAEIGFDGVELPMYDVEASPWDAIRARLDDLGLGRAAVTIVQPEFSLLSDGAAARQRGVDHLKRCLDTCAQIGAEVLAGPLVVPVGQLVGRGRTQAEWDRAVEGLKPAARHAHEVGVKLSYESLNRFETYFVNTVADATALVAAVGEPGFGLLFDTFHANLEERDLPASLRSACLAGAVNHFHVSENDRSTPGVGHTPWRALMAVLREVGYDSWMTIEAFGQALPELAAATCIWRRMYATEDQLAADGLAFLRELLST